VASLLVGHNRYGESACANSVVTGITGQSLNLESVTPILCIIQNLVRGSQISDGLALPRLRDASVARSEATTVCPLPAVPRRRRLFDRLAEALSPELISTCQHTQRWRCPGKPDHDEPECMDRILAGALPCGLYWNRRANMTEPTENGADPAGKLRSRPAGGGQFPSAGRGVAPDFT